MQNHTSTRDESVIPAGIYCYQRLIPYRTESGEIRLRTEGLCPYWSLRGEYDGHCAFLNVGDNDENGTLLLWDQVKECGVNDEFFDEDDWEEVDGKQ
jgi:hypothetical protein